jgi:hypothetical protein
MDIVQQKMQKEDIPMTRENYLNLAYLGAPPEVLSGEEEADLPEEFQSAKANSGNAHGEATGDAGASAGEPKQD